jgi:hypothetical protein
LDRYKVYNHLIINSIKIFSTTNFPENTQAAIIGNQLLISFALPFLDFAPDWTTVDYDIKAFNQLGLRGNKN